MSEKNRSGSAAPDWTRLPAERMLWPTFWPAALALGTVLLLWGLVSSPVLIMAGLALLTAAITGWLGEMRHEK